MIKNFITNLGLLTLGVVAGSAVGAIGALTDLHTARTFLVELDKKLAETDQRLNPLTTFGDALRDEGIVAEA